MNAKTRSALAKALSALLVCALVFTIVVQAFAATPDQIHSSIYGTDFDKPSEEVQLPVSRDGDLSMGTTPTATDKASKGSVTLRIPLRYKGSTNVKSSLSLFEVIPQVGSGENWPFEVNEAVVLSLEDIQAGSPETPFEPQDYIQMTFAVKKDAVNGVYPINLKVRHLDVFQDRFFDVPATSTLTAYAEITQGKAAAGASDPGVSTAPVSRPVLLLERFYTNPDPVLAANEFDLTLVLKNTNQTRDISNVTCKITEIENMALPANGSSTFFIPKVKAGETTEVTLRMKADASAGIKPTQFTLDMTYEDKDYHEFTAKETFVLPVFQELKLDLDEPRYDPSFMAGDSAYLYMNLYNKGKSTIYNVMVRLESAYIQLEENYFAGNMESGSTRTLDTYIIERTGAPESVQYDPSMPMEEPMPVPGGVMVYGGEVPMDGAPADLALGEDMIYDEGGAASGLLDGPVPDAKLVVTYEDKDGNEFRQEIPLSISVYQPAMEPMEGFDDPMFDPALQPERSGLPAAWIWILSITAAAAVAVGTVFAVRAYKRRKAQENEME